MTRTSTGILAFLVLLGAVPPPFALAVARDDHTLAIGSRATQAYQTLPFGFEPNVGQTDSRVKYLARSRGLTLFLTATDTVLMTRTSAIRMRLLGARADADIQGLEMLPGRSHLLIGRDPGHWRRDVPTYARVHSRDIYPGIDLVYHGIPERQLEYDFIVAPGADPRTIRLAFDGVDDVKVDRAGGLALRVGATALRLGRPLAYQSDGDHRRTLPARWALDGHRRAHFEVGRYDPRRPLVIDPTISLATYVGGAGTDQIFGIALGADGSVFITGNTTSANFPTTVGAFARTAPGATDGFVVKLDPSFRVLTYSTYFGGTGDDAGRGIAVDAAGNAYVTGFTDSSDFPTTGGVVLGARPAGQAAGTRDAFAIKLDPTGAALVYGTYLGGTGSDVGLGIAIDPATAIAYVTGGTTSGDFPVSGGAAQSVSGGGRDAFVTALNATATAYVYSTYLGGAGTDVGNAIAVDQTGAAYVTGSTTSDDFPTTPGVVQPTRPAGEPVGVMDAFVSKLTPVGVLSYSTYLGGTAADEGLGIVVDIPGNAFVTGGTSSGGAPPAGFPTTLDQFTGALQAFVTEIDPTGAAILLSRPVPTGTLDTVQSRDPLLAAPSVSVSIGRDGAGNLYVVGSEIRSFPPKTDAFIVQITVPFGVPSPEFFVGGHGDDFGLALAVDTVGNVFVAGQTTSAVAFPVTPGVVQPALAGGVDGFVAKVTGFTTASIAASGGGGGGGHRGGGCFIATAAFGSPLATEVGILRTFRDRFLALRLAGRISIAAYSRLSPPLARVVARYDGVKAVTRGALRPVIWIAQRALAMPGLAVVSFAVVGGALVALLVGLALAASGRRARGPALISGILVLLVIVAVSVPDRPDDRREVSGGSPTAQDGAVRAVARVDQSTPSAHADREPYEVDLRGSRYWPPTLSTRFTVRPALSSSGVGYQIESELGDGILTRDGFTVTDPKLSAAVGLQAGDRIVSVDGHPPVGGAFMTMIGIQRDPDRNVVSVQLERRGQRTMRTLVLR